MHTQKWPKRNIYNLTYSRNHVVLFFIGWTSVDVCEKACISCFLIGHHILLTLSDKSPIILTWNITVNSWKCILLGIFCRNICGKGTCNFFGWFLGILRLSKRLNPQFISPLSCQICTDLKYWCQSVTSHYWWATGSTIDFWWYNWPRFAINDLEVQQGHFWWYYWPRFAISDLEVQQGHFCW